jgi:hypothetical protein
MLLLMFCIRIMPLLNLPTGWQAHNTGVLFSGRPIAAKKEL